MCLGRTLCPGFHEGYKEIRELIRRDENRKLWGSGPTRQEEVTTPQKKKNKPFFSAENERLKKKNPLYTIKRPVNSPLWKHGLRQIKPQAVETNGWQPRTIFSFYRRWMSASHDYLDCGWFPVREQATACDSYCDKPISERRPLSPSPLLH